MDQKRFAGLIQHVNPFGKNVRPTTTIAKKKIRSGPDRMIAAD
jgi:hypothetical protein